MPNWNVTAVYVWVDVPSTYTQQFGNKQWGAFIDVVQPIFRPKLFNWEKAVFNMNMRFQNVDWNIGQFTGTTTEIGEDVFSITPGISFRPSAQTVFRLNYKYEWTSDILNNPAAKTATWMFGISTYF